MTLADVLKAIERAYPPCYWMGRWTFPPRLLAMPLTVIGGELTTAQVLFDETPRLHLEVCHDPEPNL